MLKLRPPRITVSTCPVLVELIAGQQLTCRPPDVQLAFPSRGLPIPAGAGRGRAAAISASPDALSHWPRHFDATRLGLEEHCHPRLQLPLCEHHSYLRGKTGSGVCSHFSVKYSTSCARSEKERKAKLQIIVCEWLMRCLNNDAVLNPPRIFAPKAC